MIIIDLCGALDTTISRSHEVEFRKIEDLRREIFQSVE
jgi:hypothetical protein